ncbi:2,3-bisphosphoglycerate-independent phosphoglycerate mutase, partial [Patescibacteria group bacterium]|nr:2,3-bisphosphoglycerate-independent phosphoglycerate mutase [Patescibacteria group bacterium]
MKKRACLVILDGWGLRDRDEGNAIRQAKTPQFERLWHENPHAVVAASGEAIGLPKGQMGTSEIGHLTMGAGRILFQDLVKLNKAIETGEFFKNQAINDLLTRVKKRGSTLHLLGLVSDGGVHSHYVHLYALLKLAKDKGLTKVLVHAFTDGRDCSPRSGLGFMEDLEKSAVIATVSGRYWAMDRDHNWDRTDKVYRLLTQPSAHSFTSASQAVKRSYEQKITDEFIEPVRIGRHTGIKAGDGAIWFNFRNDRPRQLMERFLDRGPKGVDWLTMTRYKPDYPVAVAYPPEELKRSLGEVISRAGLKQLRVTETEKFAHLTFFLNCKQEEAYEREDRIMIDSYSDIATHDEKPEMRAREITKEILQAMNDKTHEVIFSNLCNADMIGHTGNFPATVTGVETIDACLGKLSQSARKNNYELLITADHGNAEEFITSHTTNPVPLILQSRRYKKLTKDEAELIDIAPTI